MLSEAVMTSHTVRSVYTFMNCFYTCYAWSFCRSRAGDQVCVVLRARNLIMKLGDGLPFVKGLLDFFNFLYSCPNCNVVNYLYNVRAVITS